MTVPCASVALECCGRLRQGRCPQRIRPGESSDRPQVLRWDAGNRKAAAKKRSAAGGRSEDPVSGMEEMTWVTKTGKSNAVAQDRHRRLPCPVCERELFRLQAELIKLQEWVRTEAHESLSSSRDVMPQAREAPLNGSPSTLIPVSRALSRCPRLPSGNAHSGIFSVTWLSVRLAASWSARPWRLPPRARLAPARGRRGDQPGQCIGR